MKQKIKGKFYQGYTKVLKHVMYINLLLVGFQVANSILSEEAVLAFEWGFTTENPNVLVLWEAQYGDFADTAQIPIDCMVTGGEGEEN